MKRNLFVLVTAALCFLLAACVPGAAVAAERGLVLHRQSGASLAAPILGTTVEIRVTGIIARARVTQIFTNPTREWMEGIYMFPLPLGAAVDTLRMKVGDRVLVGEVQEKAEARQTYCNAKQQGTKATLIEQQHGNTFTTSLANIGPGETVEVAIELQQIVSYASGRFALRFPMVLAPLYTPADTPATLASPRPPVLPAGAPPINPFALHVDLAPGFPLARVASPSHRIVAAKGQDKKGAERWAVDLADGVAPADSDLVLEWAPAVGREPRAVFFSEEVDGEKYSLLMVMPPDDPQAAAARLPRETSFVIDTSGSMEGAKIEQAQRALLLGLDRLQAGDWFNVIQFNSTTDALFPASVPADPGHLERARQYVNALQANGGTVMLPALQIALGGGPARGLVQQVIFATDGQVGNDAELLAYIAKNLGEHRMFTVAIGADPNAAFLRKAAEIGRGTFTAIDSVERVAQGMGELIAQLESPMLRQIDVRWADPAAEVWPPRVPDLYLGEPLVLTARHRATGPVAVSGLRNGEPWSDELPAAAEIKGAGIDKLWARQKIDSLLDTLTEGGDRAEVKRQVTELGLGHHLVTSYTSLVAVDVERTAPAGVEPAARVLPVNAPRDALAAQYSAAVGPDAGGTQDAIVVLGESPLLDERRISTGATVSQAELEKIPAARDPWVVLVSTPGVLADRVNVGGNENGQQADAVVPGAPADQNVWELDGLAFTDPASLGASPSYFTFDNFEEISVDTGGADVEQPTAGARVRLTPLRGTNEPRGSADALWAPGTLQAVGGAESNRLAGLRAGGGEAGGPLVKDRSWLWGSLRHGATDRVAFGGQPEDTAQTSGALKLNVQLATANAATLLADRGDVAGSGLGAGPYRAPETTWARRGREELWKLEDTHVFTSNFYLTATAGRVAGRLRDAPAQATGPASIDEAGVAAGSWFGRAEDRRTRSGALDSSLFFNQGAAAHELRLGAERRRQDIAWTLTAPPRVEVAGPTVGLGSALDVSEAWQSGGVRVTTGTTALWAQDKISRGNLTLALGLRADEQDLGIAGGPSPRTLAPRLGLSWALGAERSTLLRASLSRFASRLGDRAAFAVSPGAPAALYSFLLDGAVPLFWYADNVDPLQPGRTPNAVAPDLRPEITDEAVLAVEHAFEPAFTVGLQATWRRTRDLLEERLFVRDGVTGDVRLATAADWAPAGTLTGALPGGAPYAASVYDLRPGLAPTGGRLLVNGDRWQDSLGLSLTWEKRLADRWMTRGHLSWEDWTWHLGPEFRRFDDPTNTLGSGDDDGGRVAPAVSADGLPHEPARFLGGRWSFAASGLRQLPGGFDASLTVNGRQGAPLLYFRRFARERAGLANVQLTQLTGRVDAFRTPDLATVDARLAKELVRGDLAVTLAAEAFNLLDARAAVARELDLGVTRAGRVDELVAPRTFRLGLRLQWR